MISGWSTHRKLAYPHCMENNKAITLMNDCKAFFLLSPEVLAKLLLI